MEDRYNADVCDLIHVHEDLVKKVRSEPGRTRFMT